jgi:hypothetical protein
MKLLEGLNIIEKKLVKESESSRSESHKSLEEKGEVKSASRNHHHPHRHSHKREGNISSLSPIKRYKRSGVDELRGEMNKIKPPTFDGEHKKDEDVETWLLGMRKYFQLHNYSSHVEGRIAIYQLKGKASMWWDQLVQVQKIVEKMKEFFELKRGSTTIDESKRRFMELLKYVFFIKDVTVKIQWYLSGFPSFISDKIQYVDPKTLEETIRRHKCLYDQLKARPAFQKAWEDNKKFKMDQRKKGAKPPFFRNNPQWYKMHKETRVIDTGSEGPRQPPMQCWGCKGDHRFKYCPRICEKGRGVHNVHRDETVEDMGRNVPRIYAALDNKQAKYQSHMIEVEGMINNKTLAILIDSGASHSYIEPNMVESFQFPVNKHGKSWLVQLAIGARTKVTDMVMSCLIDMNGLNTRAYLNILHLGSYDFLIGMDWLDPHHALLDCNNKEFTFLDEEGNQRRVWGIPKVVTIREISALQLKKCYRKGCHFFVAHMQETPKDKVPNLEHYAVLKEFEYVFKEVPGLTPRRDIDFSIYLMPRAMPVSKTPYRMSILELKELQM